MTSHHHYFLSPTPRLISRLPSYSSNTIPGYLNNRIVLNYLPTPNFLSFSSALFIDAQGSHPTIADMSGLVTPTYATLSAVFPSTPFSIVVPQKTPRLQPSVASLYPYASISEEAKKLGKEAQEEFRHASEATQKKAGKIDMYSPKFYAACTLGGVLACVYLPRFHQTAPRAELIYPRA